MQQSLNLYFSLLKKNNTEDKSSYSHEEVDLALPWLIDQQQYLRPPKPECEPSISSSNNSFLFICIQECEWTIQIYSLADRKKN